MRKYKVYQAKPASPFIYNPKPHVPWRARKGGYRHVATVEREFLEDVYNATQHPYGDHWGSRKGVVTHVPWGRLRSVSAGDVVYDAVEQTYYEVQCYGFAAVQTVCAHCGGPLPTRFAHPSPEGSMHAGCAHAHEAANPDLW
jgi:hypothetical protein